MIENIDKNENTNKYIQWIYDSENFTLKQFFNNKEILSLLNYSQIVAYKTGEIILKQGTKSEGIFIILEGSVNVIEKTLDRNKFHNGILSSGDFLGEVSYICNEPSPTSFVSNENVTCLFISKTYLNMVSLLSPEIHYKIIKAITYQICFHLKIVQGKVIDYIANSDMSKLSLYGRVVHSITKPSNLLGEEIEQYKELLLANFVYFDTNEWHTLFTQCQFLDAPKNCKIISDNEKNTSCYIVIRGAIQTSIMKNNKLAKLSVIGPYTLLANLHFAHHPFAITFITCESSILLKLSEKNLNSIEDKNPLLWYKIYNLICKSIVALNKSLGKLDSRLKIENYNR